MKTKPYRFIDKKLVFLLLLLFIQKALSQTITGQVTDSQTNEPLPFVNVFISNTTKGTQTDIKGNFTLKLQTSGYSKVVASMVGYKSFEQEFVLRPDEVRRLTIKLQTDTKFLNEVKISGKRDKQWKRLYKDFEREFLGRTKNARNSKILNPFQIDINRKKQVLTANALQAIEIENKALGYGISYQLESFQVTGTSYEFSGKTLFKLLPTTDDLQTQTWDNNRNQTYRGSLRHFLKAVANRKSHQEGFRVYFEKDSTLKISRNRYFNNNALIEINPDTLAQLNSVLQRVTLPARRYEIHYLNRRDPQNWYFDLDREISWIEIKAPILAFSYNGILENSYQIEAIGSMSKRRVADLLPDDYQPTDSLLSTPTENAGLIPNFQKQEKLLLNIAQNGYTLGDTVQYEVDVIDATTYHPVGQTVVYLTICSQNQLIEQQKLWVAQGKFKGKWVIPDTLKEGDYQLIVHNSWSRNFDEHFWGRKNIHIISNLSPKNQSDDSIQTAFFPESGTFIAGLSNRVGFTSFTKSGHPVSIKGCVLTPNADTLAVFQSNEEGLGSFYITPPSEQSLKAVLNNGTIVPFPQAVPKGYVMQAEVLKDTASITIKLINNLLHTEWKPMRLLLHLRGQILYEAIVTPKRNLTFAKIPREDLEGTGVMQILLLDALNHPIANRAFYQSASSSDEDEKSTVDIRLFEAELYAGKLSSELLKDEKTISKYTDIQLLTHAVRSYSLEIPPSFDYETGMIVKGKVIQPNGKPVTNTSIIGFINSDSTQLNFQALTDAKGAFSSPPLQWFGKADIVIQVQSEKVKAAVISLDTEPSYIPKWLWIPATPLNNPQKDSLLSRLQERIKLKTTTGAKTLERDFRRNYAKADTTLHIDAATMKVLPFANILESGGEGLTLKSEGAYFGTTRLALLVDGLPTTLESLKSLRGFEIEAIDIIKSSKEAAINVLLRPQSSFFEDQNLKRFVVPGLVK